MLIRLALGALVALPLPIKVAAEDDAWTQLGSVDRSNLYTVALRSGKCGEGYIVKLDRSFIIIDSDSPPRRKVATVHHEVTIARADVLRIGEGTELREILFSGRSSWADVLASHVGPREPLMVALKSGRQMEAVPAATSAADLTLKSRGKQIVVPKIDISRVLYVRYKPVSVNYRWFAQEASIFALLSPKTWQYALKINAMISVLLYDSAMPEEDSLVGCPPR
jgi:hypothetical protein